MAINNEELMSKFVRTGMIMRHIDGEGPCPHGHGRHGHHHGEEGACHKGKAHGEGHGATYTEAMPGEHREADAAEHHHGHGCEGHGEHGGHGTEGHGHGKGKCGHGKHRRGQARVLTMISMQEGINQKDLAFLLGIRPQTLGAMLQKLEERGLVERKKSEADGRAIEVTLTDEGRTRAAEISERRALAAADMFGALSEEEKEQLSAILDKLNAGFDKHRPHGCK